MESSAGKKGWRFLKYDQMQAILNSRTDCIYCHAPFSETNKPQKDRKDSTRGYDFDNIVLACRDCNIMKSDILTYDEMLIVGALVAALKAKRNIVQTKDTKQGCFPTDSKQSA